METPQLFIAGPVVPMFRGASGDSEQVSQALLAMPVVVERTLPGWREIRTPDGYSGWVREEDLTAPPTEWDGPCCEVTDLWANLRGAPDFRRAALLAAPIGTRLPRREVRDGWVQLLLPDGRLGWTEAHRVADLHPTLPSAPFFWDQATRGEHPTAASVCATARRFLGIPYLWGGCSPWGLDCSGFVQLVFRLNGILLRRDANQQAEDGREAAEPGRGDLVFFGPPEWPGAITHVGLLLDRTRFIHASGSDRVRINRLDEPYHAGRYRFARRFLPEW